MPTPVYTPRVNNNDDTVRLSAILVDAGAQIRAGDPILEVETDKANFTVEAETDGYLLAVLGQKGDMLAVGSTIAWIGASADEAIPAAKQEAATHSNGSEPTLKALLLLKSYGLRSSDVPASGDRLSAQDVERFVSARGPGLAPGSVTPFTPEHRSMVRTVTWHRDEAVAGYVEFACDPAPWEKHAAEFQKANGLLLSPLLPLMAKRLASIAAETPRINATVVPAGTYVYEQVNLGFTVQAGSSLYLVVVRDAAKMPALEFVNELSQLQRAAMKHALKPEQTTNATIGFTSMARWKVSRHIPILPPQTGIIVAHTAPVNGVAYLGASYDHRLLTGFDVVQVLQALSTPGESE